MEPGSEIDLIGQGIEVSADKRRLCAGKKRPKSRVLTSPVFFAVPPMACKGCNCGRDSKPEVD
jgi:hypothetical protein